MNVDENKFTFVIDDKVLLFEEGILNEGAVTLLDYSNKELSVIVKI